MHSGDGTERGHKIKFLRLKKTQTKTNHCTLLTHDWMMQSGCNWSVLAEYLPPLLLTLRRWQHWWQGAPCPCSHGVGPVVHPGSQQRNHKWIYLPCLYFSLYMRLWSAKSERSPDCLAGPSHSLKHSSWVSNCSAWLSSLFRPGRGELPGWSVVGHLSSGELLLTSSLTGF